MIGNSSNLLNQLIYLTEKRLKTIRVLRDDIAKIIQNLDPNKAYGHVSVCMLKIYGETICKQLECMFRECLSTGIYLLERKKNNLVPIIKKADKQC